MDDRLLPGLSIFGRVGVFLTDKTKNILWEGPEMANLVLLTWGHAVAQAFGAGLSQYKVAGAYIEFKNVTSSTEFVLPPTYNRSSPDTYFQNLSPPYDYLRVPLATLPTFDHDPTTPPLPPGKFNRATFTLLTTDNVGHKNHLNFSAAELSRVFGVTLYANPSPTDDPNEDVFICRTYFSDVNQLLAPVSGHIGIRWRLTFA